ncbi:LysR family transcriptional regulator [Shewanella vesiculosa]|uniref:LysR family transcriptional regulator n=1 Tax=Shewanella vesiculosa TaxID=518738 RepID=UPI000F4D9103|nr:LysR family transcriptional regulator [Shewanella vesiculosa]RPA55674.1 LysR family transcriptional regulator [Shewanella vesiculosa]UJL41317.1 LysR family transcriptional regulator [Shewanella vesiculosa]
MNLRQLHYFYELAKFKHFAKAAKACHITQPTLSASITALEKSFGTELVVRGSQFVALTDAGQIVLRYAEKMLLDQVALKQELSVFSGPLIGSLRIGIVPQSSVDIMPIIKQFNELHPNITITLLVTTNEKLIEQLTLHQIDIGLGFDDNLTEANRRTFYFYPQMDNDMAVLASQTLVSQLDTPLSDGALALKDLQQRPLVLLSQNMQFRQYIDNALAQSQLRFNVVLETDSLFHLVSAVKHDIGYAIVSSGIAKSAEKLFNLHYRPLQHIQSGNTVFITRKYSVSPAMNEFVSLINTG